MTTIEERAVVGRHVTFTHYRDLAVVESTQHPGIITGLEPGLASGSLVARIRLDGTRSNLVLPADYEGLTYLDEVTDVPDLPMGAFTPVADDRNGFYEVEGALYAAIGEDGELVILTDDLDVAKKVARAYSAENYLGLDDEDLEAFEPSWAVFTWEPEDAESPWTVNWDAAEGDDHAIRIYRLPA
ncbi:hypothetical protein ACFV0T_26435 [Streptomyces sp. NPDC059582]|uniref:hypothetical protein n=1 Tax=Streptomyces sp. NPDC059582 TaxID=3346875 RepID=UPI0036922550